MDCFIEPAYWALLAVSVSAWAAAALLRPIGSTRLSALLLCWTMAIATTGLLFGALPALLSAAASLVLGLPMLVASLVWSGVKSMPKRRFEER